MRALLIAATFAFFGEAWSQAGAPAGHEAEVAKFRGRLLSFASRYQGALAVIRYAASNAPVPPGLRGIAFSTDVRLQFSLKPGAKRPGEWKA